MRYNGNELKQMALNSKKVCTKEGVLCVREKDGKLWNKTDVLTERWCRLVDNLFFYFKSKDDSSDPHGVFILEGFHVRLAENDPNNGCGFVLEFEGDNRMVYFLASHPSEAKEWIHVLKNASYTKLKQQYEMLKKQQGEGEDVSGASFSSAESRSATSSPLLLSRKISPKDYNMTLSDIENSLENSGKQMNKKDKRKHKIKRILHPDSLLPLLELHITCADLSISKVIDHKRYLQIQIHASFPPVPNWTPIFETEAVKATPYVEFLRTASFFHHHLITPQTLLKFSLCQIKENGNVEHLGHASCTVSDLLYLDCPVHFSIENENVPLGKLGIEVCQEHMTCQIVKSSKEDKLSAAVLSVDSVCAEGVEKTLEEKYGEVTQIHNFKALYCEAISRTYRFPTTSGSYLSIQEMMLETKLSFHIPLSFLKLLIDQETRHIGNLDLISNLPEKLVGIKQKRVNEKSMLLQNYHNNVKSILNQIKTGPSFKPSVKKGNKEFEFVPINLHLQRMRVKHSDFPPDSNDSGPLRMAIYDIVTVGAAAAHCLKFKQGGLLSHISSMDKSKKSKDHTLSILSKNNDPGVKLMKLYAEIQRLHTEIDSLIKTLQTFVSAGKECRTVPSRSSTESTLDTLSNKICELTSLMDDNSICEAVIVMNGNSKCKSGLRNEWEEEKTSVKTTFAQLLKLTYLMLDEGEKHSLLVLDDGDIDHQSFVAVSEYIQQLTSSVSKMIDTAMQGHAMFMMTRINEDVNITYRRDVVFSQALAACVCGISTNLLSSLKRKKYLGDTAKHGILIQFESLLSTYGNEMGMLEDFIVGVMVLQTVTFTCERARRPDLDSSDWSSYLLPTLHGTRDNITVRLHLDQFCFDQLPESLQRGDPIRVVPVLFNVGINEEQTLAEKFRKTSLQEYINMESFSRLFQYIENLKSNAGTKTNYYSTIDERMRALNQAIHTKKNKNVEILQRASEICNSLNGVRVTSCKSAKDRTAMAVTLEQVQNLVRRHELNLSMFSNALSCMRSEGTRRENTKKNIGVRKYAFTSVQLLTFPKQYRAPDGTYGKAES